MLQSDVVIVGAGYAGLAAALRALDAGASVTVLGRQNPFSCNSALGSGQFLLVNTPLQKQQGIEDSAGLLVKDILSATDHGVPLELLKAVSLESLQLYDWLTGLGAHFVSLARSSAFTVARVHVESGGTGANTFRLLLSTVGRKGGDIRLGTVARRLITSKSGGVEGVLAVSPGEEVTVKANRAVVLAAGGFARDRSMMQRYLPELADLATWSGAGSTGDGIRMGAEAGAELVNMNAAVLSPTGAVKGARVRDASVALLGGGILVNERGERFVDEKLGYGLVAAQVLQQPNRAALLVFDETVRKRATRVDHEMDQHLSRGLIQYGRTAQELADKAGIEPNNFKETIDRCRLSGALYGTRVRPALVITHGGLRVNARAQVIHRQGHPIPHLYAAGDNTPGLGGPATPDSSCPGYVTGDGYLWALTSGRIAGLSAAQNNGG